MSWLVGLEAFLHKCREAYAILFNLLIIISFLLVARITLLIVHIQNICYVISSRHLTLENMSNVVYCKFRVAGF
jgi:hypothetical protein